ncbi:MAG: hypothetical protein JNG82_13310 [Opitutaceae bacterium]|jgi:hypothetical protein|nr:hypothetical protein [Opitutaceae bacterium]HRG56083.1 hypothetical protein [Lacunisphaera sp.]
MKPEELLDPAKFPEDLQWVAAQQRLHPQDPVFLLIAWHWNRMNACEDSVRLALAELKAGIDGRIDALAGAADTVNGVNDALAAVQAMLEEKPALLGKQFEAELRKPVTDTLARLQDIEKRLAPVARDFQVAQRRQLLATLLIGVALGVLSAVIALVA